MGQFFSRKGRYVWRRDRKEEMPESNRLIIN
jgi:hypothetical protein